jgi:hypothetical protein
MLIVPGNFDLLKLFLQHPFVTGELDDLQPLNHAARKV